MQTARAAVLSQLRPLADIRGALLRKKALAGARDVPGNMQGTTSLTGTGKGWRHADTGSA